MAHRITRRRHVVASLATGSLLLVLGCASPKPAWELPAPPVHEAAVVAEGALTTRTLANGLRVMLLEDRSLPMVSMGLVVRRGAAVEPLGKEGVGELCVEVMQRGAGPRDALQIAEAVEELGASLSVSLNMDSARVVASSLSRDADFLLGLLADVALRPHFDETETEKARNEQMSGLAASLDDPRTLLGWQLGRTLYPAHRYGIPLNGLPGTVPRLTADDARKFHGRIFVPNNAVFYATGNFDRDELLNRIETEFGAWEEGVVPEAVAAPPPIVPPARKIVVVDRPEMGQAQIAMAHEGLRRSDPRRIPASLLNNVLGGSGFSSRLTVRLRSDEGLTYSIRSGFALRRQPGHFGVSTFTRADQMRSALDLLLEEVEAIRSSRTPTDEELRNAKAFSVGQFALGLETSASVMRSLVNLDLYGLPEDSLDTYRRRIGEVTQADVAEIARTLLHPDRGAIVVVGPAAALVPELESLGDVEVVTW